MKSLIDIPKIISPGVLRDYGYRKNVSITINVQIIAIGPTIIKKNLSIDLVNYGGKRKLKKKNVKKMIFLF